jgi:hypothetical protein
MLKRARQFCAEMVLGVGVLAYLAAFWLIVLSLVP